MTRKTILACPIDNRRYCTLPMAAVRLGVPAANALALLTQHGVPFGCYHFRKDRAGWSKEEAENFAYAESYLGLTEADYPFETVWLYSGTAVRQLVQYLVDKEQK